MDEVTVRAYVVVSGRVQGVGFRAFTQHQANTRQFVGWVKNVSDGNVELEVEGPRAGIEEFLVALRQGPPFSKVSGIKVEWTLAHGAESDFHVLY